MSDRKLRVLIVDDSTVVRQAVSDALAADPLIDVVGSALDRHQARDKIIALKPDVLALDIEMPRMDGLTFLRIIMAERPMPVIILSSLSQSGAQHALEALRLGAIDVMGKPQGPSSLVDFGPQLREKVKAAAAARVRPLAGDSAPDTVTAGIAASFLQATGASTDSPGETTPPAGTLRALEPTRTHHPRRLILLGASTGGTEALRDVLTRLPGDLPPIAIVQHIPAVFSNALAHRLDAQCRLEVREAVDGDLFVPGLALIAPGNRHMLVHWTGNAYRARIVDDPPVGCQRPAVDPLFHSVVDPAGHHAIAGILTGMGRDGAEGLLRLRRQGALTFSQDEASSVVYDMPRAAWEMGGSQRQVPLDGIAHHLVSLAETAPSRQSISPSFPTSTLSAHASG